MDVKYFPNIKTLEELKREYRKLGKQFHPDNGGNEDSFKKINHEYNLLKKKFETKICEPPLKVLRYSRTGAKWFNGIQITDIVAKVKKFLSEKYPELTYEIESDKDSFLIRWKQKVDLYEQMKIKRVIEKIIEEHNKFECIKYPYEPVEEKPFFRFMGFEKYQRPIEEMEDWEICGYSCDWSKYYKTA